ncbi:hypothetical protein JZ751_023978 [Albula glossodonta]|uniref:Protein kinase domain-containing protein n=1 Tax=Albula glossodonta TaxID=121402 RepID=A0A8T2NNZ1_9TELE|nr:hypothetical protein JZ751_023978 [Albula glossodonta]
MVDNGTMSGALPYATEGAGSGPYAVIIIPVLLAVSTVIIVVLIVRSVCCKRQDRVGTSVSTSYGNGKAVHGTGRESVFMSTVSGTLRSARDTLSLWEIPDGCTLKELEFLQTGRYGPICKCQLSRAGITSTVVVKTLRDSCSPPEVKEFVDWARFHASVCKHEKLVQMLFCRTQRLPLVLVLEAEDSGTSNPSQHFSEKSVYLVAKQVAEALEYLSSDHRLVHGDVAARSVLIGSGLSVRVSGLGMAFQAWQTGRVAKRRVADVPLKWQAPERITRLPLTDRSDVYDLMQSCWMWNYKDRPAFPTIIKQLKSGVDLADAKALSSHGTVDIFEYSKTAGVFP